MELIKLLGIEFFMISMIELQFKDFLDHLEQSSPPNCYCRRRSRSSISNNERFSPSSVQGNYYQLNDRPI